MITCSRLGKFGRLGNQLFQIAATIGHAQKMQTDYAVPDNWEYAALFPRINKEKKSLLPGKELYKEPCFEYRAFPGKSDLDLFGYFQSEKYFSHCADHIRDLLNQIPYPSQQRIFSQCFIHIRRGDFLKYPGIHPVLSIDYYKSAIYEMARRGVPWFFIFSDDMDWCKTTLLPELRDRFYGDHRIRFHLLEETGPVMALRMMSWFQNAIIANSSFSWWGAWLGDAQNVIAPATWFGPDFYARGPGYTTQDLIPERWTVM